MQITFKKIYSDNAASKQEALLGYSMDILRPTNKRASEVRDIIRMLLPGAEAGDSFLQAKEKAP